MPSHLDRHEITRVISKHKDADCLHLENMQKIMLYGERMEMLPCTPAGVLAILDEHNINVSGMQATVIGRSLLVGFPLSLLLMKRNATVTICHRFTRDLQRSVEKADLVVSAAGCRGLVKGEWVKEGSVVIDVGINAAQHGSKKIVGDVEFDKVLSHDRIIPRPRTGPG